MSEITLIKTKSGKLNIVYGEIEDPVDQKYIIY